MFATGDRVKIIGGAFEDFEAKIEQVQPSGEKARVLISIYGREETIEVALSDLKPILSN